MSRPQTDVGDSPSVSITMALLSTVIVHYLFRREQELCSEILCWACLPMILKPGNTYNNTDTDLSIRSETKRRSPWYLWAVAGSIAIFSFCRAEGDSFKLLPAVTPLLILAQRGWKTGAREKGAHDPSCLARLATGRRSSALIAGFAIMTLSDSNCRGFIFSALAVGALFIVYVSFLPRTGKSNLLPTLPTFESCASSLAPKVVGILSVGLLVRALIWGFPRSSPLHVASLGAVKALSWRFTAQSAHHTSWNLAPLLATFGLLSTRSPFDLSSESQALSNVVASILSLGQIIGSIPGNLKLRWVLWLLLLLPLVPYLANVVAIQKAQQAAPIFTQHAPHPVEALFNRAEGEFQHLVERQSSSYDAACTEYGRRYGTEPPPGFEDWYNFASSNNSPLIDDFDTIHQTISPFRKLSGKQIIDMITQAKGIPGVDLWSCQVSGTPFTVKCRHPLRTFDRHISLMFNNLLMNITKFPDVSLLVNHIDEPRVLFHNPSKGASSQDNAIDLLDYSHKPTWNLLTENCDHSSVGKEGQGDIKTFGLPFVTNLTSAQNLCHHPKYSAMHGLTVSPVSFRPIRGAVPVLSTGKLSTMRDILFPSPAYTEHEFLYDESKDVEWDKKRDNLYWAGSTTGGFALDANWQHFHRQRFVELGQNLKKNNYYLRMIDGVIQPVKSSFLNGRLFNIVFTRVFQCQRRYCRDQDAYFKIKTWADKDEALGSKLVFDIDGNGISGRYYKLLASKSVPLKQTLLQEWHDDRLVPWLHFIPVSQSMEELPELVFYLTSTQPGRQIARSIAGHGQRWHTRAFREIDFSIYTYRLLLELARLQDPQREADLA